MDLGLFLIPIVELNSRDRWPSKGLARDLAASPGWKIKITAVAVIPELALRRERHTQ